MNDGHPLGPIETAASILAKLTGTATLATGALLYGAGTAQAATLAPPANDGSRWALSHAGGAVAPAWSNKAAWRDQANVFTGTITVPDGAAATPGIRLTGEAHGLHRVSATAIGVSVAGVLAATFAAPNGSSLGGTLALASPSAAEPALFFQNSATDRFVILSGSTGPGNGGQVRAYGSTHATKAGYLEFCEGATVRGYFAGSLYGFVLNGISYGASNQLRLVSSVSTATARFGRDNHTNAYGGSAEWSTNLYYSGGYQKDTAGASSGLLSQIPTTTAGQYSVLRWSSVAADGSSPVTLFEVGATGIATFAGKVVSSLTSGTAITLGSVNGTSSAIDSSLGNLIRHRAYGYSPSYTAVQISDNARGVGFGVDPNAITGSQFSGDARDVFFRRGSKVLIPNAGATDWETLLYLESGSNTLSAPIVTIATAGLTVAGTTTTTYASVTGTTASTTPATGAHVVAGGVGIGGGLNVAGASGIGGSFNGSAVLTVGTTNPLTGATQVAVYAGMANTTAATTRVSAFYSAPTMTAGSYTTSYFAHFDGVGMTVPSGITVTNWHGLIINAPTFTGTVTNAYGIRSIIASGTNRWNLYLDGTASNYLNGQVLIGTTTDGMTAGGSLAIAQDLAHRGTKAGFYNATPVTRPTYAAWTGTANRATKDTATATLVDVAQTVKALVDDLRTVGLLA